MGSSKCDLYLENYVNHYTGGQTIVGYALCNFVEPKQVHGIFVKIKGEATTHWSENESTYNSTTKRHETRSVYYSGSHQLLSQEVDLLHNSGMETLIPAGVHKYPFAYRLPDNLPSTYEHNLGKIQYKIKAVVKRPLLKFNYEAETAFNVVTPINLNNFSTFQNPQTRNKLKSTYCCCWSKGNINVSANIPKAAFILGEPLPLHIQVENLAQTNIEDIKVKIKSIKKFTVTSPSHKTRVDSDTIFTDTYGGVGAHGENTYDKTILIDNPSLVMNNIDTNIIKTAYEMQITFVLSGLHTNIDFEIPVMLGHIPFGIVPPPVAPPSSNYGPTTVNQPTYGFVQPQPAYNPNMMPPGMPAPTYAPPYSKGPEGAFGGYPPAPVPAMPGASAPMAPSAPTFAATAPAKETNKSEDWAFVDNSTGQDLPSYDQAMRDQVKM